MLSFSASDAPRGAPRFFHQKSQEQNEKQIRAEASGPNPLPTPVVNGGRRRRGTPALSPIPSGARTPGAEGSGREGPLLPHLHCGVESGGSWRAAPHLQSGKKGVRKPLPTASFCVSRLGPHCLQRRNRLGSHAVTVVRAPGSRDAIFGALPFTAPPAPVAPQNLPPDGDFSQKVLSPD